MFGNAVAMLRSVLLVTAVASVATISQHPLLLVVSFDGFRPDYVQPDVTPHLARFRDAAAAPPYMRNVFPTKTFVNHFTIATGLYAETHGVLDNYMFDRNGNLMHYKYEQFHYNEAVVPIWVRGSFLSTIKHNGIILCKRLQKLPDPCGCKTHLVFLLSSAKFDFTLAKIDKIQ